MPCGGCSDRRRALGEAARAVGAARPDKAAVQVKIAAKSLTDDAKAFARGLKVRLIRR